MQLDTLPRQPDDILEAIEAARAEGPAALARLAILCMWRAGRDRDPHKCYASPFGEMPLGHLEGVLEHGVLEAAQEGRPVPSRQDFLTYGASVIEEYPRPHDPRERPQTVSRDVARPWVGAIKKQMDAAPYLGPRAEQCYQGVIDLWARGVGRSDLQPLIDELLNPRHFEVDTSGFSRMRAAEVLMRVGAWEEAVAFIEQTPITDDAGVRQRMNGVRWLIATGRPDLARPMLETLAAQRDHFPEAKRHDRMRELAQLYVYLGDEATARALRPPLEDDWEVRWWEAVVALSRYYRKGIPETAGLRTQLEQTRDIEPPKVRAARQYDILAVLLAIDARDAAQQALDALQATLLATPVWGKREHRTDGAVQVLLPYLDKYPEMIHAFAAGLLVETAKDVGDFWNIVFVVSGLRWLIWSWVGGAGIQEIVDFVRAWQTAPATTEGAR